MIVAKKNVNERNMKKRIKELREDLALSQEKFGNLVGVTRSHIASMENGKAFERFIAVL